MLRDIIRPTISTWLEPALYLVRGIGLSVPPSAPQPGDVYIDDSNQYRKFDGTSFIVVGIAQVDDRVVNIDTTTQNVFEFIGSLWIDQGTESDNSVVVIDDNGANNTRQYTYKFDNDIWIRTDPDKTLDGGFCRSVYLPEQSVDSGNARGVVGPTGIC